MQRHAIGSALIALALLACGGVSVAADPGPSNAPAPAGHAPATSKKSTAAAPVALVDINSATRAQLRTLPGIGEAEAQRIIAGRPYLSKADLATRKVIPTGIFLSLKDRIIAIQKQKPKGKS
jgi:DNA uptake protein ComE-like DNA-binding protein